MSFDFEPYIQKLGEYLATFEDPQNNIYPYDDKYCLQVSERFDNEYTYFWGDVYTFTQQEIDILQSHYPEAFS